MNFVYGFLFGTIVFLLYVFLSPGLKGIAFRPDVTNKVKFSPMSIAHLMTHPLHNTFLWNPSMLTCNWIFISVLSGLIFSLL